MATRQSISRRITYLGNQNLVTGLHADGNPLSLPVVSARANSEDLGLVELLDGALGEEDAAGRLGLGLDALDKDAVEEGREGLDGLGCDGGLERERSVACWLGADG